MSLARQNYSVAAEEGVNAQINAELSASYGYLAMALYFGRDDVALLGFSKFFHKMSVEEREHADEFIEYQNKRGGRVVLAPINAPKQQWASALEALEDALATEKAVNAQLLKLHKIAEENDDPQFTDFLEGEFLKEQVDSANELAKYIAQLKRCGEGLGVYIFDKDLQ
jgi:ferritin heavy chain